MAGPKDERSASSLSSVRAPAVAGLFYPEKAQACREAARSLLSVANAAATLPAGQTWRGGIVPHAGWICSGAIAGQVIGTLAAKSPVDPDVVVVFGAIHTPLPTDVATLDPHARWQLPGATSPVATDVERHLVEQTDLFATDERFHRREHAVEVELPLIQEAFGASVPILPIEVPALQAAISIGQRTAEQLNRTGLTAIYLASSDLTHYGPNYRFTPGGPGLAGLSWAQENDRRLLQLVTDLAVERIVPEAQVHHNACGAGAIAAMLAACQVHGATRATVLRHANSYEVLREVVPGQGPDNAVGYAAVLVG